GTRLAVGSEDGFQLFDITNPVAPQLVGTLDLGQSIGAVVFDGSFVFAEASGFEVLAIDLTTPANPVVAADVLLDDTSQALHLDGDRLYVGGYGTMMHVVDVSNPTEPSVLGWHFAPVDGDIRGLASYSGVIYAAASYDGMYLLPPQCEAASGVPTPGPAVARFVVRPPFPNPSRGTVNIDIEPGELPLASGAEAPARVLRVSIVDVAGRLVRHWPELKLESDEVRLTWDGRDNAGLAVPAGVFFVRVSDGQTRLAQRLVRVE
ncbi:MAG TPA: FlgD immunoglobulin-like domain containing protein, partial [Candidatus Eisenbacteria bacterium]